MRSLVKEAKPQVLSDNEAAWLAEFLADRTNATKKYRYRNPEIKAALRQETGDKCIYCESKLGHNTPGDVEHLKPTAHHPDLHFTWENLSLACTECNRRKGALDAAEPFINPYVDHPEDLLDHLGPIVLPRPAQPRAELFVRLLDLNSTERFALIRRKAEKLWEAQQRIERYLAMPDGILRSLMLLEIQQMTDPKSEYSGMIRHLLVARGLIDLQ